MDVIVLKLTISALNEKFDEVKIICKNENKENKRKKVLVKGLLPIQIFFQKDDFLILGFYLKRRVE